MAGWIKIHRELMGHWVSGDPASLSVFVRLLCEANFVDKKDNINGSPINVKRGQLIFGLPAFSKRSGVSISTLRRVMKNLQKEGMIDRQNFSKFSIVSIINYESWQSVDSQEAGKQQAKSSRATTPEEVKEFKKVENTPYCESSDSPKQVEQDEKPKKRKTKHAMPDDFAPNETNARIASELGVDLYNEVLKFSDHHGAKGSKYLDWNLALNTWLRNAAKFAQQRNGGRQPMKTSFENADYSSYETTEPDWLGGGNGQA